MTALGMIETKGLLTAIEGADAMLKAANVHLLEKHLASGGLVTIIVAGEVSAVRAAVDAGVSAISRVNAASLVSEHVIARPDGGVGCLVAVYSEQARGSVQKNSVQAPVAGHGPGAMQSVEPVTAEQAVCSTQSGGTAKKPANAEPVQYEISQLKKMNVSKLRQIARGINGLSIAPEAVKSAGKKDLIEAIVNSYRQIEE